MNALHVVALHRRGDSISASAGASLRLRIRVFLTRGSLDRQLASGRPHLFTPALALRARQLVEPRTRRQVARTLRKIVEHADRRTAGPVCSAVMIEPVAVRNARHPILGLAERLEGPAQLNPAGIARAQVLITDGLSPLFDRNSPRTATQAIYDVQDALEGDLGDAPRDAATF
jgi:hypothetical protein